MLIIVVVFFRICCGFDLILLREDLNMVVNFLYMIIGEEVDVLLVEVMNKVFVLYVDYEFNVFIFIVWVCVVMFLDVYFGVIVVIGVLKGLFYGGVNECVFDMLEEID